MGPGVRRRVEQGEAAADRLEVGRQRGPQALDVAAVAAERAHEAGRRGVVTDGAQVGVEAMGPLEVETGGSQGVVQACVSTTPSARTGGRSIARTCRRGRDPAREPGQTAGMDLRSWIAAEHAAVLARFEQSVVASVPLERWTDPAGTGGSSIAWLAFHTAFHEDLAVNAVLRRDADRRCTRSGRRSGWRTSPPSVGLGEAEQPELTAALDVDALLGYVRAVHDTTATWLATLTDDDLDVADAGGPDGLARAGIAEADVPWLHRMWDGQAGGVVRAVGGHRPPRQPPRRDGVGPQPPRPQPVLTDGRRTGRHVSPRAASR